jgi:serine/threonine protein phosphatase 1
MWKPLKWQNDAQRPRLEEGVRVYAVGDVHGRADLLDAMLWRIDADRAAEPRDRNIEVFVGDYVDRGPSSRTVLDRLAQRAQTHGTVLLRGNHEHLLLEFLSNPIILAEWQRLGGLQTLLSYGLKPPINASAAQQIELADQLRGALPASHQSLLRNMPRSFTCGDFFFVHAGLRPGVPIAEQNDEDLLWIRDDFLLCAAPFDKFVVHGHTPVVEPDLRSNRINIDTGAYATGRLSCIKIELDQLCATSVTPAAATHRNLRAPNRPKTTDSVKQ